MPQTYKQSTTLSLAHYGIAHMARLEVATQGVTPSWKLPGTDGWNRVQVDVDSKNKTVSLGIVECAAGKGSGKQVMVTLDAAAAAQLYKLLHAAFKDG